jgi:mono/diheme cytochrome c family protein
MDKYIFSLALAFGIGAAASAAEPPPIETVVNGRRFIGTDGAALYRAICQGCHMPDAQGAQGAGRYPPLADNPKLTDALYPALTVLKGRNAMPAFGAMLSDAQIAAVVNYLRTHFGNRYGDKLTAADIAKFR